MKLLIIDNEVHLRNGLKLLLEAFCPEVEIIAEADGVKTGLEAIKSLKPDIVLLDVEMDDGTGFDLMKQVDVPNFQLIFVTAHNKYAIDAFQFSAIDYLLKPVDPEALQKSIQKAIAQIQSRNLKKQIDFLLQQINGKNEQEKRIVLKDIANIYFVKINDILYCEAEGTYTKFVLQGFNPILVSKTMKEYEAILEPLGFLRTHNSFLANPNKINMYDKTEGGSLILEGGYSIPVSQRKKDAILSILEGRVT
jgi:two-component system, LytTR family, response regulator